MEHTIPSNYSYVSHLLCIPQKSLKIMMEMKPSYHSPRDAAAALHYLCVCGDAGANKPALRLAVQKRHTQ